MNVFLVEDSPSIRRLLVRRLESMPGARIVGEASGQEQALAMINWLQPDLVLLDLSLATGSGLQVLAGLRRGGFDGHIMVLTSQSAEAYRQACEKAGADAFYDKASGLDTLFDDIGALLARERELAPQSMPALLLRDGLTGLFSQGALLERLDQATRMAARDDQEVAVYVLMLRGLDALRDLQGEAAVNQVLVQTATRLEHCTTPADVLARSASDQFSLVLTRVESAIEATMFAQRLAALLAQPFDLGAEPLFLPSELGVALFPRDAVSARALLTLAEADAYGTQLPRGSSAFAH
ncbi:MAG TPA: diguanylate cyclase [Roseateles sp.]|nr:diguanylate cyclase [Roseateles sp.]